MQAKARGFSVFLSGGKQTEGGKDGLLFGRESQNLRKNQIFSPQSVYFY